MNYVKLTKAQKQKQREARNEFQIILKRCRAIKFDYLISRPPQKQICFNSGSDRKVLPQNGRVDEIRGPGHYELTYQRNQDHPVIKKKVSKNGFGSLAFRSQRFRQRLNEFGPFTYAPNEPTVKPHHQPFGISFKITRSDEHSLTPGPGTYNTEFERKPIFRHSFGGQIKVSPAVEIICTPENLSKCRRCEAQPRGDYWKNFVTEDELCLGCMQEERKYAKVGSKSRMGEVRRLNELQSYLNVRHCEFFHDHGQHTAAAVRLFTPKQLQKRIRRENYLSMFRI